MLLLPVVGLLFFQTTEAPLAARTHQLVDIFFQFDPQQLNAVMDEVQDMYSKQGLLTSQQVGEQASYEFAVLACISGEPSQQIPRKARDAAKRKQVPADAADYCEARQRQEAVQEKAAKQPPSNPALRDQIEKLLQADQAVRQREGFDQKRMDEMDREHSPELEAIYAQHGVPTYALVGAQAAGSFVTMIQHQSADFRRRVLPKLKANVAAGQADTSNYALVLDRSLSESGKKQVYGQNLICDGQHAESQIGTIEDAKHVDQRRAKIGLWRLDIYARFVRKMNPPCALAPLA